MEGGLNMYQAHWIGMFSILTFSQASCFTGFMFHSVKVWLRPIELMKYWYFNKEFLTARRLKLTWCSHWDHFTSGDSVCLQIAYFSPRHLFNAYNKSVLLTFSLISFGNQTTCTWHVARDVEKVMAAVCGHAGLDSTYARHKMSER